MYASLPLGCHRSGTCVYIYEKSIQWVISTGYELRQTCDKSDYNYPLYSICVLLYKEGRYNHLYMKEFIDENSEACAIKSKYQAELHFNRDISVRMCSN